MGLPSLFVPASRHGSKRYIFDSRASFGLVAILFLISVASGQSPQDQSKTAGLKTSDLSETNANPPAEIETAVIAAGPLKSPSSDLVTWVNQWSEKRENKPNPATESEQQRIRKPFADRILRQTHYHFLENGNVRITRWEILRVLTRDAATQASQLSEEWSPWRMDKPKIRARVITKDGREIANDGRLAFEQAASDGRDGVLTDDRRLTLILNGVEAGAIVESVAVSVKKPVIGKSSASRIALTDLRPFSLHRMLISADENVEPVVRCVGGGLEPTVSEPVTESEPSVLVFEVRDPAPFLRSFELNTGPDVVSYPMVIAARTSNWEQLGREYSNAVEKSLGTDSQILKTLAASAGSDVRQGTDEQKLKWAVQTIRQLVRYTGLAFGRHSIFPVSPNVLLARRFGDCKDQSTALVGLLRELDVKAHVALVDSGRSIDVPLNTPCMDLFNHAIVYVQPLDRWVDISAEQYPYEVLPPRVRARRALICQPEGGKMRVTSTYSAKENYETETHTFSINFSGGGAREVEMTSTGDFAIDNSMFYEEQPDISLRDSWNQYFTQNVGIQGVPALKSLAATATKFHVYTRSNSTQIFSRDEFTTIGTWDHRFLLASALAALQPPAEGEEPRPRRLPLYVSTGTSNSLRTNLCFPEAFAYEELPESWERKLGAFTLSTTFRDGKTSDLWRPVDRSEWRDHCDPAQKPPAIHRESYNKTIQVTSTLTVNTGKMTAAQVNECRALIGELFEENSPLTGSVELQLASLSKYTSQPSNETMREIVDDAKRYKTLRDPHVALMSELAIHGLSDFAREQVEDLDILLPEYSLSNVWIPGLRGSIDPITTGLSFDSDFRGLQRLIEKNPDQPELQVIRSLIRMSGDDGLLKLDPAVLKQAFAGYEQVYKETEVSAANAYTKGAELGMLMFTGLAIREDKRLLATLQSDKTAFPRFLRSVILDVDELTKSDFNDNGSESFFMRMLWELFVSIERWDLVERLQVLAEKHGMPYKQKITKPSDAVLPNLDMRDHKSVAKHAMLAALSHDVDAVKQLWHSPERGLERIEAPSYGNRLANEWFVRRRGARTKQLIEATIALTPIKFSKISEHMQVVTFYFPYNNRFTKRPMHTKMSIGRDVETGHWKVTAGDLDDARLMIGYAKAGQHSAVTDWLDHYAKKHNAGLLGLLAGQASDRGTSQPPAYDLWNVRSELPRGKRAELTAHAIVFMRTNDDRELEKWLDKENSKLSKFENEILNRLRLRAWSMRGNYEPLYDLTLERANRLGDAQALKDMLECVFEDRNAGGKLYERNEWRETADQFFANAKQKSEQLRAVTEQYDPLEADYQFALGENDKAFALVSKGVKEAGRHQENACNKYLWNSLVLNVPKEDLRDRLTEIQTATDLNDQAGFAYLDTLACTHARLGDLHDAMKYLKDILPNERGRNASSLDLDRGLLLEQLGYHEAARSKYQAVLKRNQFSQSSAIARAGLARIKP